MDQKIKIYTFPSQSRGHVATAIDYGCWAVHVNKMPHLQTKSAMIQQGDFGIFYCSNHNSRSGYLCHPFRFESTPSDDEAESIQHLWQGGPWQLGFSFTPIGTGMGSFDKDAIKELHTVKDSFESWHNIFRLSPMCAFNPVEIYSSDWELIVHACSPELRESIICL